MMKHKGGPREFNVLEYKESREILWAIYRYVLIHISIALGFIFFHLAPDITSFNEPNSISHHFYCQKSVMAQH